ncbi:DUF5944 family protein [Geodermatophilus sp. SYSU D01186]
MPALVARPLVSMVRNSDFATTSDIGEVFGRHRAAPAAPPVSCQADATVAGTGVRLRFTSRHDGVPGPTVVSHRFTFIDREEVRLRLHTLTPEDPDATSELLVLFDGTTRDYCHAAVYDQYDRMLGMQSFAFDDRGRVLTFPFTGRYVSPLPVADATAEETEDDDGRRVLRFTVRLGQLDTDQRIVLAWQAVGIIRRPEFLCTPAHPVAVLDVPLEDNPEIGPGDWVMCAVDSEERLLAQTLLVLQPAA